MKKAKRGGQPSRSKRSASRAAARATNERETDAADEGRGAANVTTLDDVWAPGAVGAPFRLSVRSEANGSGPTVQAHRGRALRAGGVVFAVVCLGVAVGVGGWPGAVRTTAK